MTDRAPFGDRNKRFDSKRVIQSLGERLSKRASQDRQYINEERENRMKKLDQREKAKRENDLKRRREEIEKDEGSKEKRGELHINALYRRFNQAREQIDNFQKEYRLSIN